MNCAERWRIIALWPRGIWNAEVCSHASFPIAPDEQEARVRAGAAAAGLVMVRRRPVVLREGERPLLGLFVLMRADDLPEAMRDADVDRTAPHHPRGGWDDSSRIRDGETGIWFSAVKMARNGARAARPLVGGMNSRASRPRS